MPFREAHLRRWQITAAFLINVLGFFVVGVILETQVSDIHDVATANRRLIHENEVRVQENRRLTLAIQASRIASCKKNYESFNEVFKPFLPPPGKGAPQMQARVARFRQTIRDLKRTCIKQTKPISPNKRLRTPEPLPHGVP